MFTAFEERIFEVLLEFEQSTDFGVNILQSLTDFPEGGFNKAEIIKALVDLNYLDQAGENYWITTSGKEKINNLPIDWVIRHLPLESHSGQK